MAEAVADALATQSHLVVEAPTGVGKTLAYLIPAVLYALGAHRKAIVSTYTKNLQEQILHHDIPIARAVLGKQFNAVLLKGRRNYLCPTRLDHLVTSAQSLFDAEGYRQVQAIAAWATRTSDGDLEGLGFPPRPDIWDMVCSERDVCSGKRCGSRCFFQQAKERARHAHLVIMNHALSFTLMAIQGNDLQYIFENDFVIFDEAHTIEGVAGAEAGKNLSRYQVLAAIHKLFNPRTKRGLLAEGKRDVKHLCARAEHEAAMFFDSVRQAAAALVAHPGDLGRGTVATQQVRIRTARIVPNTLDAPLADLQFQLHTLAERSDDEQMNLEMVAAEQSLREAQVLIREFLEQKEEGLTYWVECAGTAGENVTLCASPTDMGAVLGPILFREGTSAILTSATLTVSGSLDYFQRRIGAQDIKGIVLDSPFDHTRQMRLRVVRSIPEPDTGSYAADLSDWILRSVRESGGRALVLFTSNMLMNAVASELSEEFEKDGFPLLVQGANRQRSRLLEQFRQNIRSVLFGLDSFWMGIDVPGEALEHVIITRLPFSVPSHPLIEARIELIAQRGGNAFIEYTLPEAVLKFRQGVGRLLRSRSDKGLVTILDSRIITKRYGRVFLSSIPRCPIELITESGESQDIALDEYP
jgi:ATP-dependent DNA helicase DinG